MSNGLLLLALSIGAPSIPSIGSPRLARGDELAYRGSVSEGSDRPENRFRKASLLDVRILVLDVRQDSVECAVLTRITHKTDQRIADASAAVAGRSPDAAPDRPAAARVDLIRLDARSRVRLLTPVGPLPLRIDPSDPGEGVPPDPIDGPPIREIGMFLPLPAGPATVGTTWDYGEPGRPLTVVSVERETVWNGGRVFQLTAIQQTDGYDRPAAALTGWRRTDTILVSPTDGYACSVARRIDRRTGASLDGWVEVRLELQPTIRHIGTRFADIRHDAEAAALFGYEADRLTARNADPRERVALATRMDQLLADPSGATSFRDGVEAARRRCLAVGTPTAPAVVPAAYSTTSDTIDVGRAAPDFSVPEIGTPGSFRLSAHRGTPTLLVFVKPGSTTTRPAVQIAETLHRQFGSAAVVRIVSLAPNAGGVEPAGSVPVLDGSRIRTQYGVDTFPRFILVDGNGTVAWRFDGFGLETGFLAKSEIERIVRK